VIRNAVQYLQDQLAEAAGETVTYTRGESSWTLKAVQGRYQSQDPGDRATVLVNVVDFIIRVSDWTASGATGTPQRGDTVYTNGQTFKVIPVEGEGEWRYTSSHAVAFRVHSQRIL
jgi:hypothetical protein